MNSECDGDFNGCVVTDTVCAFSSCTPLPSVNPSDVAMVGNVTYVLRPAQTIDVNAFDDCRTTCGRPAVIDNKCQFDALIELLGDKTRAYVGLRAFVSDDGREFWELDDSIGTFRSAIYSETADFHPWVNRTVGSGEDDLSNTDCSSTSFCAGYLTPEGLQLGDFSGISAAVICEYGYAIPLA